MNAKHELILNIVIGVTDYLPSISNVFNSNSKEKNSTYGLVQIISNPAGATITSGAVVGIFVSGIATGLAIAAVVGLGATTYICYKQMNKEADDQQQAFASYERRRVLSTTDGTKQRKGVGNDA